MNEQFEFKSAASGAIALDELQGIVECFVAGIGNKDSVGDIVVTGAFAKSLTRRKPRVVWAHSWNDPIGKVLEMYEVPPGDPRLPAKMKNAGIGGLYAKVQFNLQSEKGKEAFASVAFFGEEQEWSIGYKTINGAFDTAQQANVLREVELYEVSPVLHGANQLTGTISVKSESKNHMMPIIAGMPMMGEQPQQPRMIVIAAPQEQEQEQDEPFDIFAEGLAQPLDADKTQKIQSELSERTGSKVDIVEATDSFIVFRRTTTDGKVSMYRVGYHTPDGYNTFMFGKPEVYSGSENKPQVEQQIEVKPADASMVPMQPQQMPYRDDDQDEMNTMLGGQVGVGKSAYAHLIEIPQSHMIQAKSMLQPVFNYHNLSTTDSDNGIIVNGSISAQAIDALQNAVKAIGQTIGQSVGNLRTLSQSFNPFAIDGDNDGFAQDGTTFQRPYIPIKKPDMNLPDIGGKNRDSNELLDKPTIRTGKKPLKDPSLLSGTERQEALAAGELQPRTMDDISFLANRRPENEGIAKYWDMSDEGLRAEGQKLVAARRGQTGSDREKTDAELFKLSHEFSRRDAYKQQFGKDFVPPKRTESTGKETFDYRDLEATDDMIRPAGREFTGYNPFIEKEKEKQRALAQWSEAIAEYEKGRSKRGFGSRGDATPEQQDRINTSRKRGSDIASGRAQVLADNLKNLSDEDKDYIRENGIVSFLLQDGNGPLTSEWGGENLWSDRIGDLLPEGDWSTDSKLQSDAEDIFASYEEGFYGQLDKEFADLVNPADLDTPKAKRDRQRAAGQGEMFDDFDSLSADEQDSILEQGRDSARGLTSRGETASEGQRPPRTAVAMQMDPKNSKLARQIDYDPQNGDLTVYYRDGKKETFNDVPYDRVRKAGTDDKPDALISALQREQKKPQSRSGFASRGEGNGPWGSNMGIDPDDPELSDGYIEDYVHDYVFEGGNFDFEDLVKYNRRKTVSDEELQKLYDDYLSDDTKISDEAADTIERTFFNEIVDDRYDAMLEQYLSRFDYRDEDDGFRSRGASLTDKPTPVEELEDFKNFLDREYGDYFMDYTQMDDEELKKTLMKRYAMTRSEANATTRQIRKHENKLDDLTDAMVDAEEVDGFASRMPNDGERILQRGNRDFLSDEFSPSEYRMAMSGLDKVRKGDGKVSPQEEAAIRKLANLYKMRPTIKPNERFAINEVLNNVNSYANLRGSGFASRGDRLDVPGKNNDLGRWLPEDVQEFLDSNDDLLGELDAQYYLDNPGSPRPGARDHSSEAMIEDLMANPEKYGFAKDFRKEAIDALKANGADRDEAENVADYWIENDGIHDEYLKEADGDSLYAMALAYDNYIDAAADDYNERQRGFGSRGRYPSDDEDEFDDGGDDGYDAARDAYLTGDGPPVTARQRREYEAELAQERADRRDSGFRSRGDDTMDYQDQYDAVVGDMFDALPDKKERIQEYLDEGYDRQLARETAIEKWLELEESENPELFMDEVNNRIADYGDAGDMGADSPVEGFASTYDDEQIARGYKEVNDKLEAPVVRGERSPILSLSPYGSFSGYTGGGTQFVRQYEDSYDIYGPVRMPIWNSERAYQTRFADQIVKDFSRSDLTVDELADRFGITPLQVQDVLEDAANKINEGAEKAPRYEYEKERLKAVTNLFAGTRKHTDVPEPSKAVLDARAPRREFVKKFEKANADYQAHRDAMKKLKDTSEYEEARQSAGRVREANARRLAFIQEDIRIRKELAELSGTEQDDYISLLENVFDGEYLANFFETAGIDFRNPEDAFDYDEDGNPYDSDGDTVDIEDLELDWFEVDFENLSDEQKEELNGAIQGAIEGASTRASNARRELGLEDNDDIAKVREAISQSDALAAKPVNDMLAEVNEKYPYENTALMGRMAGPSALDGVRDDQGKYIKPADLAKIRKRSSNDTDEGFASRGARKSTDDYKDDVEKLIYISGSDMKALDDVGGSRAYSNLMDQRKALIEKRREIAMEIAQANGIEISGKTDIFDVLGGVDNPNFDEDDYDLLNSMDSAIEEIDGLIEGHRADYARMKDQRDSAGASWSELQDIEKSFNLWDTISDAEDLQDEADSLARILDDLRSFENSEKEGVFDSESKADDIASLLGDPSAENNEKAKELLRDALDSGLSRAKENYDAEDSNLNSVYEPFDEFEWNAEYPENRLFEGRTTPLTTREAFGGRGFASRGGSRFDTVETPNSSAIEAVHYDRKTRELHVAFKPGQTGGDARYYTYSDVSPDYFDNEVAGSSSIGRVINDVKRNHDVEITKSSTIDAINGRGDSESDDMLDQVLQLRDEIGSLSESDLTDLYDEARRSLARDGFDGYELSDEYGEPNSLVQERMIQIFESGASKPASAGKKPSKIQDIDVRRSAALYESYYDPNTEELVVTFKDKDGNAGGSYIYEGVTSDEAQELASSSSKGKVINKIKASKSVRRASGSDRTDRDSDASAELGEGSYEAQIDSHWNEIGADEQSRYFTRAVDSAINAGSGTSADEITADAKARAYDDRQIAMMEMQAESLGMGYRNVDVGSSAALNRVQYDPDKRELRVEYRGRDGKGTGEFYIYENVPQSVVDDLEASDSRGATLRRVRDDFDFRREEAIPESAFYSMGDAGDMGERSNPKITNRTNANGFYLDENGRATNYNKRSYTTADIQKVNGRRNGRDGFASGGRLGPAPDDAEYGRELAAQRARDRAAGRNATNPIGNIDRDGEPMDYSVEDGFASRGSINESSTGQRIVPSRMHSDDREALAEITDPEERKQRIDSLIEFYGPKIFAKPSKPKRKKIVLTQDENGYWVGPDGKPSDFNFSDDGFASRQTSAFNPDMPPVSVDEELDMNASIFNYLDRPVQSLGARFSQSAEYEPSINTTKWSDLRPNAQTSIFGDMVDNNRAYFNKMSRDGASLGEVMDEVGRLWDDDVKARVIALQRNLKKAKDDYYESARKMLERSNPNLSENKIEEMLADLGLSEEDFEKLFSKNMDAFELASVAADLENKRRSIVGLGTNPSTPKSGGDLPKVDPLSVLGGYSDGDVFGLTPRGFSSRGESGVKRKTKEEVFAEMQKQLIAALEDSENLGKWKLPWRRTGMPENGTTGRKYSGSNWFFLSVIADARGFDSNKWATYNQWQGLGGQVRKGEKGTTIFVPMFIKGKEKADGTSTDGRIMFKVATVFNLKQIDGMPDDFDKKEILPEAERVADLEKTISEIPAVIKNGGDKAFFQPSGDFIQVPDFENFNDARSYYSTVAHELMHWTGGNGRLGREQMGTFGTPEYAYEELVAEIASAMFMASHNIEPNIQENHGPYLASWLKKLKDDPEALEKAMTDAQKAVNYVLDISPNAKSKFSNGEKAEFETPEIAVVGNPVVAVQGLASRGDWPTSGGYEPSEFDMRTALSQIGRGNLMAISGTRAKKRNNEMVLPVNKNQQVIVGYNGGSDTYFVRAEQIITSGKDKGKTRVLGQWDNVYADELGETSYQASLKPSMLSDDNKAVWAQAFDHPQTGSLLDENGQVYENGLASGGDSMDPDELDAMDWAYDAAQDYMMEQEDMMPEGPSPEDGFASRMNLSQEEKNEIIAIARRMGNRFTTSVVGQYDRNGELSDKQWDALNRMTLRKQGDRYVRNTRGLASRGDKKRPRVPKTNWTPEDRQRYVDGDRLRSKKRPGKRRNGPDASEYGFSSRGEPIDILPSDITIGEEGSGRSWGFEPIVNRAARRFGGKQNMTDEQLAAELGVPVDVARKMRKPGARTRDVYLLDRLRIQVDGDRNLWGVGKDPLSYYDESGKPIDIEANIPDTGDMAPDVPGTRAPRSTESRNYLDASAVLEEVGIDRDASRYSIIKDNIDIFGETTWKRILSRGITAEEVDALLKAKKSKKKASDLYGDATKIATSVRRTDSMPLADVFSNQAFDSLRGKRGFPQQVVEAIAEVTGRRPSISTAKNFINNPRSSGRATGRNPLSMSPAQIQLLLEKLGISSEEFDKFRSE